jgi:prefoldin subunit 5
MKTELAIDKLERELKYVRTQNQKMLTNLHKVKNTHDYLRKKFQQKDPQKTAKWLGKSVKGLP